MRKPIAMLVLLIYLAFYIWLVSLAVPLIGQSHQAHPAGLLSGRWICLDCSLEAAICVDECRHAPTRVTGKSGD